MTHTDFNKDISLADHFGKQGIIMTTARFLNGVMDNIGWKTNKDAIGVRWIELTLPSSSPLLYPVICTLAQTAHYMDHMPEYEALWFGHRDRTRENTTIRVDHEGNDAHILRAEASLVDFSHDIHLMRQAWENALQYGPRYAVPFDHIAAVAKRIVDAHAAQGLLPSYVP